MPRTILAKIKYRNARLIVIHCFDNRPIWFKTWSAICAKNVLLARVPLAGASAMGPDYNRYFKEKEANKLTPIVLATHFPCGWWECDSDESIIEHGEGVVKHLNEEMGFKAIHIHFRVTENKQLEIIILDPLNLEASDPVISRVVAAAKAFTGEPVDTADLQFVPFEKLIIADEIFGPPAGDGLLVTHKEYVLGRTIEIAQRLNGDRDLSVRYTDQFEVPNYDHEGMFP